MPRPITTSQLPHSSDARVWAREWLECIKNNPGIPTDEGCMIGWFARALMSGYDEAQRRNAVSRPATTDIDA